MKIIKFLRSNFFKIAFIKTFLINFRTLPFKQAIHLPIVIYDRKFKLTSIGKIKINTESKFNLIEIGKGFFFSVGQGGLINSGLIIFNGKCSILKGAKITNQGIIELGNNSLIGENMSVIIRDKLFIGNYTRLPFNTVIMDSSGHPVLDIEKGTVKRFTNPIYIGNYCWVGNSSTINGGTYLPDYTIVTNRSLLNKDYSNIEKYCLMGGTPAKVLKTGLLKINKIPIWYDCLDRFNNDPNLKYIDISEKIKNLSLEELSKY